MAERINNFQMASRLQAAGLKNLLNTNAPFRKFMWTIIEAASIYETTHRPGQPDTSAHMEGRRALGLLILDVLNQAEPDAVPLLWREGNLLAVAVRKAQEQEELAPHDDPENPTD